MYLKFKFEFDFQIDFRLRKNDKVGTDSVTDHYCFFFPLPNFMENIFIK